jgi:multidrug resistance efflux pump
MARRTRTLLTAAGLLLAGLAIWPVHYRVPCSARVETARQRIVATPFEAMLLSTKVQPGDQVQAGEVLVELDGRPLRLEREAIEAEIGQFVKEYNVALATRRIADAQQAALKEQHLRRQHELLTDRLGRLEVVSPIDGIVVSGDLEKFIGAPLERGQTLIEVSPLDTVIIEIEIPEYEIGYVSEGAATRVKLNAIGGKSIRAPLAEVFPASELRDDRNVFIGRIEVENSALQLRPGMRGQATTYGPLRPWIWSWIRGAIERGLWWIGY